MELEKITSESKAAEKRRFRDACGLAHGLELVGERWSLLIVRELLLGPRRFSDLRGDLPGLSANVLTQRLTELEARHIVEKRRLPPPANIQVYALTEWGREAEPMVLAMARWAYRSPAHDRMQPLGAVPMLLSLKANLDADKAKGLDIAAGFLLGGAPYRARLADGIFHVEAGEAQAPDFSYEGSARSLAGRIYGRQPLDELARQGTLTLIGNAQAEAHFAPLFALPPRFAPAE